MSGRTTAKLGLYAVAFMAQQAYAQESFTYRGMCDASAAVALGANHFVVADDEMNTLRIFSRGQPGEVGSLDVSGFLLTKPDKESDLEGAAAIGARIYWISSHGRNSKGESQDRRYRFFATDVKAGKKPAIAVAGKPYVNLLDDLLSAKELKAYKLADAAKLAPEAPGGLNIEGLAATPEGGLLIAFRNPLRDKAALVVPLLNPQEVIGGKKPRFGAPIELALGGRGIRSLELIGSTYLIVAGPTADDGTFALYRWSGKAGDAASAVQGIDLGDLRPEALFAVPGTDRVQLLSDDGGVKSAGVQCKDQADASKKSFRSMTLKP